MIRNSSVAPASAFVLIAALAAGCTQGNQRLSSADIAPQPVPQAQQPLQPSTPTPPPVTAAPRADAAAQPLDDASTDVAVADPIQAPEPAITTPSVEATASAAQPVSREALIGAWTVASGSTNCQIFLALTKWSGGFRAAQRGCSGSAIGSVQAWDVKNNRVVLTDGSGTQVASLSKTGGESFSGTTGQGGAISFSR